MTDVSLLDYAFLAFEDEASPKHVAALQIFERPADAPDDFVAGLVDKIKRIQPEQPFNWRLETSFTHMPQWVEVPDLDLGEHVFHASVPKPHTLAALLREVAEEVGVVCDDVRYVGSQPWPFPHSLMIGFRANHVGGDIVCEEGEIADAGWYRKDDLPMIPPTISIAAPSWPITPWP